MKLAFIPYLPNKKRQNCKANIVYRTYLQSVRPLTQSRGAFKFYEIVSLCYLFQPFSLRTWIKLGICLVYFILWYKIINMKTLSPEVHMKSVYHSLLRFFMCIILNFIINILGKCQVWFRSFWKSWIRPDKKALLCMFLSDELRWAIFWKSL